MTIETLRSAFSGVILTESTEGFANYPYPAGAPTVIVRPQSADDVIAAIAHARSDGLSVSVRSGGHSGGGWTWRPGGLVIDMSGFTDITVTGLRATIGSGATWGTVAETLGEHGLALSSGDTRSVGVGGLTLGGGVGWVVRKYGLALDSLVSARIVTADGRVVTASGGENPDLFWAIRGGGGNFGVVLDFTFEAHRLSSVLHGVITFDTQDLAGLLRGYRDALRDSPTELNATFMLMPPMGPQMPGGPAIHVVWAASDDAGADEATGWAAIAPLLEIPGIVTHDIRSKAYADVLDDPHPPEGDGPMPVIVGNNGWAPDFSDEAIDAVAELVRRTPGGVLMIRYLAGRFNQVDVDATAFAWRDAETLVIAVAFLPPDADAAVIAAMNEAWLPVSEFTEGTYGNFTESTGDEIVGLMYPPATLARLRSIKYEWDPENVFDQNQNIAPARP